MASKNVNLTISEKQTKNVKGRPTSVLTKLKTVESEEAAEKLIEELKKKKSALFEVKDEVNNTNTIYNRMLGGKNYTRKVLKIGKK